jgi:hypothetical protein
MKQSWQAYKKNFTVLIAAVLISAIPSALIIGFGILAASDFSPGQAGGFINDTYLSQGQSPWGQSDTMALAHPGWFVFSALAAALLSSYLLAGFYGVCLMILKSRTGVSGLSPYFKSVRERGLTLIAARIILILIFAGIAMGVLAVGIIFGLLGLLIAGEAAFMYIFVLSLLLTLIAVLAAIPFFITISPLVVSGRGVSEAIRESVKIGRKDYWGTILFIIPIAILEVIVFILSFLSGTLGILFSLILVSPMVALMISSFYLEKFSGKAERMKVRPSAKKAEKTVRRKR